VLIQARVENIGDADGTGTVVITVDTIPIHTGEIDIRKGKDINVNTVWIAVEGNHTIVIEAQLADDPTPENNVESGIWTIASDSNPTGDDDDDKVMIYLIGGGVFIVLMIVVITLALARRSPETLLCPTCNGKTEYSKDEDDHYCWNCGEYTGEMRGRR